MIRPPTGLGSTRKPEGEHTPGSGGCHLVVPGLVCQRRFDSGLVGHSSGQHLALAGQVRQTRITRGQRLLLRLDRAETSGVGDQVLGGGAEVGSGVAHRSVVGIHLPSRYTYHVATRSPSRTRGRTVASGYRLRSAASSADDVVAPSTTRPSTAVANSTSDLGFRMRMGRTSS